MAGIAYAGVAGSSADCGTAILQLLFYGEAILSATILTHDNRHCLLLKTGESDFVAVKSGFSSTYAGEGPRTFSFVLQVLMAYSIEIDEIGVSGDVLDRLDLSALTNLDIDKVNNSRALRPSRWRDYIINHGDALSPTGLFEEVNPVIPLGLIDIRIIDLAIHFEENPDGRLLVGYRRLEDLVRARTNLLDLFGAKLFQSAFGGDNSPLHWDGINPAECQGRVLLFTGTYMAYRNPRAHQENLKDLRQLSREFMLLNHLYSLEVAASLRKSEFTFTNNPVA